MRAGPILLSIIGISLIASGFFVMDPASTPRLPGSVGAEKPEDVPASTVKLSPRTARTAPLNRQSQQAVLAVLAEIFAE